MTFHIIADARQSVGLCGAALYDGMRSLAPCMAMDAYLRHYGPHGGNRHAGIRFCVGCSLMADATEPGAAS